MCCISLIDTRLRRIPNRITLPGAGIALVLAATAGTEAFVASVLGVGMALVLTGVVYAASRGGFGMGDVKLSALIGAVIGASAVPMFLLLGAALGAVAALVVVARTRAVRGATMAYGPYLALAGVFVCCWVGPVALP